MEKFALLNLLNALNSLSAKPSARQPEANADAENNFTEQTASPAPPQNTGTNAQTATAGNTYPNVMASVLERHEAISNRVKNKK